MRTIKAMNLEAGQTILNTKGDKERGTVATVDVQQRTASKYNGTEWVAEPIPGEYSVNVYNANGGLIVQCMGHTRIKIA